MLDRVLLQSTIAQIFLTEDVMDALKSGNTINQIEQSTSTNQDHNNRKFYFQQPVAWDEAAGAKNWYIGSIQVLELSGLTLFRSLGKEIRRLC